MIMDESLLYHQVPSSFFAADVKLGRKASLSRSPVHAPAVWHQGHSEAIYLQLDCAADIHAKSEHDDSLPLIRAAWRGHLERVRSLVDKQQGASIINERDCHSGSTALIGAATGGHLDVVRLLLDRGADCRARNNRGDTALIAAATQGHVDVVRLLLHSGGCELLEQRDNDGASALDWAGWNEQHEMVRFLQQATERQ